MSPMSKTTHSPARLARVARVLFLAVIALACAAPASAHGDEFKLAPPIKAPGLDGKVAEISYSDAPVTLVNFWATWCLPCREEMPAINRLFEKYRSKGFRAVGLALQSGEPAQVKEFLESRKLGLTYPILLSSDELAESYGDIEIVPTTYLIGPKGEVIKGFFGLTGDFEKTLETEIEKLLKAKPAANP